MSSVEADRTAPGVVRRLHELLSAAVRERRGGDPYAAPVTVAEIYQELAPYRNVRSSLGLDMNADYEHTLLRLLAGEGGLARIEPASAREQIARELESPNPNVALYRKFASCDVHLQPAPAGEAPTWIAETLAEEEPLPLLEPEPDEATTLFDAAEADPEPPVSEASDVAQEEETAVVADDDVAFSRAPVSARCAFCDSGLPRGRAVRYCPYCGADQEQHPCGSCGEPVESDWAFCVACGEPQGA